MRKLLVITISLVSLAVAGIAAVVPALAGGGSVCRASSPTGGFVTPEPVLFGRTFDSPMPGHNPPPPAPRLMPWHYDMHVW